MYLLIFNIIFEIKNQNDWLIYLIYTDGLKFLPLYKSQELFIKNIISFSRITMIKNFWKII